MPDFIGKLLTERSMSQAELEKANLGKDGFHKEVCHIPKIDLDVDCLVSSESDYSYAFHEGKVLYIAYHMWPQVDTTLANNLQPLLDRFGSADAQLKSNLGWDFLDYVYLKDGISVSGSEPQNRCDRVVVFQPQELEHFKKWIWADPNQYSDEPDR